MTTLYLINRQSHLQELLPMLGSGDRVLLCGDAVLAWQQNWPQEVVIHLLVEDVVARNIQLPTTVSTIDYAGFVELCALSDKVTAW